MKIDPITPAQYGLQLYVMKEVERLGFRIECRGDDLLTVTYTPTNHILGEFGTLQGVQAYINGYVKGRQHEADVRSSKEK